MEPSEDRLQFTQRALDAAREYLHLPYMQRRLGRYAAELCEVAMNARAIAVVDGTLCYDEYYEQSEIVPVIALVAGETAVTAMLSPTPVQCQSSGGNFTPWRHEYAQPIALPPSAAAVTIAEPLLQMQWAMQDGMRYMEMVPVPTRPTVVLRHDDVSLGKVVSRLIHEFAHVGQRVHGPLPEGVSAERSLTAELRAFGMQALTADGLLAPRDSALATIHRVEQLRQQYNGSIYSDTAFMANPALQQHLHEIDFTFWYAHD